MSLRFLLSVLLGFGVCASLTTPAAPETNGPLAKDGNVEVVRLTEERIRRGYAVKSAQEQRRLEVDFSVFVPSKGDVQTAVLLYRFHDLEPVLDDTGKVISQAPEILSHTGISSHAGVTYNRLTQEVSLTGIATKDDRRGTDVTVRFDAPARQATKIPRIRGKVEVIEARSKRIEVKGIAGKIGKRVVDPDLVEFEVKPTLTSMNRWNTLTIEVTGKTNRLWDWELLQGGKKWEPKKLIASSSGAPPGGREYGLIFEDALPDDLTLVLKILVPVHRHVLTFDLRDILLP